MSPRLFISYRTEDAVFAGRIYDSLKLRFGADRIFFDQRSIRAGAKWDAEIDRSLAECGAFVLVITPRWARSFEERAAQGGRDYHLREIELALDRGMPILPLVIDDAVPPADATLPEALRGRLSMIQWERVRNDRTFDDSMDRLGAQLAFALEGPESAVAPGGPGSAPAWLAPPPPRGRAVRSAVPADLLATKEWRWSHSVWPWGLLCCGIATGPVFLYMGARAGRRSWVLAGFAYLAVLAAVMVASMAVTDGSSSSITDTSSTTSGSVTQDTVPGDASTTSASIDEPERDLTAGETIVSSVFLIYAIVGLVHLLAANPSWLRFRAGGELATRPRMGAPPPPPPPPPPPSTSSGSMPPSGPTTPF